MEKKYIIPATIAISYLIYKKFYAIDFKELDYSQQEFQGFDLLDQKPLFTLEVPAAIGKSIDDIDWEEVSG